MLEACPCRDLLAGKPRSYTPANPRARSLLPRSHRHALELEEPLLARQPAAIAAQLAAFADHAVAWDHDGDPVVAIGRAHGAHRLAGADGLRHLLVGARLAVRNGEERAPDLALERSPRIGQR